MAQAIRLAIKGPLACVTLDRPPLNILTTAMLVELGRAFETAGRDEAVRVIRLEAAGKVFSAGVDVADHVGERIEPMIEALTELFVTLEAVRQPTVSVVHGAALGGGCELVLATDLCWASERASFGLPEIRLGLFAPPASVLLPRLIGERRAFGLLLSGETISAAQAEAWGLVNQAFSEERFAEEVALRIERLLALSGAALAQAKAAVRAARGLGVIEAHRTVGRQYTAELMRTADAAEGLAAFLEKRPPVWKHA